MRKCLKKFSPIAPPSSAFAFSLAFFAESSSFRQRLLFPKNLALQSFWGTLGELTVFLFRDVDTGETAEIKEYS